MSDYIKNMEHNRLFLLSAEEYEKYKNKICQTECRWWLRTPSFDSECASWVDGFSPASQYNGHVVDDEIPVRPALKIKNLELMNFDRAVLSYESISINPCKIVNSKSVLIEYSGIEWEVIDAKLGLVISHEALFYSKFDNESNDYETSYIKKLLDKIQLS